MSTTGTTGEALRRTPTLAEIEAMLDAGGPFDRHRYPGFVHRPGQKKMLQATAAAFAKAKQGQLGVHLTVEGGTGIGKSLAYLVPAAVYAAGTKRTVVITTNTINLQDQLVENDIPEMVRVLEAEGILYPNAFSQCTLKGQLNYLCRHRWENGVVSGSQAHDDLRSIISPWLSDTENGDRAEINLSLPQQAAWKLVSSQLPWNCPYYHYVPESCFLAKARKRAQTAHLLVVNHALYLNTVKHNSGTIPPHHVVIIDEAHRLADEASKQLGAETDDYEIATVCDEARQLTQSPQDPDASMALTHWEMTWNGIARLLKSNGERHENGTTLDLNSQPAPDWDAVVDDWKEFTTVSLRNFTASLQEHAKHQRDLNNLVGEDAIRRLADSVADIRQKGDLFFSHEPGFVRVARENKQYRTVSATPLQVSHQLQEMIFNDERSTVLTSATLAPNGDFTHTQQELGISPQQPTTVCESPFHYHRQAMFLSPRDMPSPSHDAASHQTAVQQTLLELARSLDGRTLALFTSHSTMKRTAQAIEEDLSRIGIELIVQGKDGPASRIAKRMIENPRALAMGVDAMWEGIDLPPDALNAIAICRLPFPTPSDPVNRARSILYDDPFYDYYVTHAVRRFRQGCGRLIRSDRSKGVIVVLDPRIRNYGYGNRFLEAMPPVSRAKSFLSDIADIAANFVRTDHQTGA